MQKYWNSKLCSVLVSEYHQQLKIISGSLLNSSSDLTKTHTLLSSSNSDQKYRSCFVRLPNSICPLKWACPET
ncbi:Hypothetical predicted protein [Cloeon dipterum]|uniref:Uncharacterized protein n=1 Tax=Cloeon dipterum TaxID=197152 RepID=A0A8S1EB90_9INSE|nr:Hypothetical predicted protein [Cloeon dipterum]